MRWSMLRPSRWKRGKAINLFHCNLPRLSVDIDPTYLLVQLRKESLSGISTGLGRITEKITTLKLPDVSAAKFLFSQY
ncbi:hypothetical protein K3722_16460 [Leisingera caerulea]|uniref:Uncharacterized protein n=1 Tax=Leisingera caerulea TaxID=506591 RepID=A0ABY5WVA4_LEICA|nr:hypothetical protein [Leisingera caerulea]UWQ58058.1 hypothetical protein K3722_16460 [Leisingera caerulea]